jgi:3-polyprenyl-4-hydroxybenzoate decarboxylase
MRAFLAALDRAGDLKSIAVPVNAEFEIAACLTEADPEF